MPLNSETPDNPVAQGISDINSDFFNVDLSDYKVAEPRIKKIVDDWDKIKLEMERLRALRFIRVDKEWLQAEKIFQEDQTYVATRLIDSNIRAEQPQYLSYITQSPRAAIFEAIGPNKPTPDLLAEGEKLFTAACRYLGWEKPFIRVVDGSCAHGWDTVEILYAENNPGNFEIDHVGHANLCFCTDAEDANNQEIVLRRVNFTAIQLKQNVKDFGFNPTTAKQLIESNPNSEVVTKDVQYTCFKYFYRNLDGTINVGWFGSKCTDWLKDPEPLFLGIRDITKPQVADPNDGTLDFPKITETEYPFYMLPYTESEDPRIIELKGRAFLDEPSQEAASGLLSSLVNGNLRASQPYCSIAPSPVPGSIDSAPPKALAGVAIKPGLIWDKPLNFFGLPYPPAQLIQAFQAVTTANKAETAKVDAAVNNRQDSRKTATEISAATQEAAKLTSVQVTLLSIFMRQVYARCWSIYKNRVLQGKIIVAPELKIFFSYDYNIKSSGDVDVIQRQQKIALQFQAWPVFQSMPFAQLFIEDIVRNIFPEEAEKYIATMNQVDPRQLILGLATVVRGLTTDPKTGQLDPHYQQYSQQLQTLAQQVQAYLSSAGGQQMLKGAGKVGQQAEKQISSPASSQSQNGQPQTQPQLTQGSGTNPQPQIP